jgi:hypothetical protein
MSVRTTQRSSFLFRFFTIPFLLLLFIALALDGLIAYSLRPSGDQPTLQLTAQRKNAQSTISLQNPSLPKAVP